MKLIEVRYENIQQVQADEVENIVDEYKDVFTGLGSMPGKVHLTVDPEVKPVVMPPRKVPLAVKPLLKEELDRLENLEVIEKVEGPSDWVSSLVVVNKPNGKIRVCIDPMHLNKALKREHYPLPCIEDVLPQLTNVKVFSKADLKEGFLQCSLDDESAELTTFQTPWGRYRYRRLPFGVSPSPELFEMRLDMREPEHVPGVQRFVGMVQYLATFLPALSGTIEPLRKLTHKDTHGLGERNNRPRSLK